MNIINSSKLGKGGQGKRENGKWKMGEREKGKWKM
jgi:hypothetical protein